MKGSASVFPFFILVPESFGKIWIEYFFSREDLLEKGVDFIVIDLEYVLKPYPIG